MHQFVSIGIAGSCCKDIYITKCARTETQTYFQLVWLHYGKIEFSRDEAFPAPFKYPPHFAWLKGRTFPENFLDNILKESIPHHSTSCRSHLHLMILMILATALKFSLHVVKSHSSTTVKYVLTDGKHETRLVKRSSTRRWFWRRSPCFPLFARCASPQ